MGHPREVKRRERHEHAATRLRGLRVRVTSQRILVLEALRAGRGHLTADEIMAWVADRAPATNLATVYRALDLLVAKGVVARTDLGGRAAAYELLDDTMLHHHLVCDRCGNVVELDDDALVPLRDAIQASTGFRLSTRHLALFGTCAACLGAERPVVGDEARPPESHSLHTSP